MTKKELQEFDTPCQYIAGKKIVCEVVKSHLEVLERLNVAVKAENDKEPLRCHACLALDKKERDEDPTEWDNNCALTAKREKEEANRTADREKGIFKKPTVKQMKKIAKLIKENK